MKLVTLLHIILASISVAEPIHKRTDAFICGPNFTGGCCNTFFKNQYDQYSSGVSCSVASQIPLTPTPTTGEKEWVCANAAQTPGCCEAISGTNIPTPWWCNANPTSTTTVPAATSTTSVTINACA